MVFRGAGEDRVRAVRDLGLDRHRHGCEDLDPQRCQFQAQRLGEDVDCAFGGVVGAYPGLSA